MSWIKEQLEQRDAPGLRTPSDNPDLSFMMSFITAVGGASSWLSKRSTLGLVSGLTTSAVFGLGGYWTLTGDAEKHETAHQFSTLASMLFAGAMSYRASANPYVGPGGSMLAALGVASSAYHFAKTMEWREFGRLRAVEAERELAQYRRNGGYPAEGGDGGAPGSGLPFGLPRAPPGGF